MANKIIKELWKIKDDIAEEFGYDVKVFVSKLRAKKRERTNVLLIIGKKRNP